MPPNRPRVSSPAMSFQHSPIAWLVWTSPTALQRHTMILRAFAEQQLRKQAAIFHHTPTGNINFAKFHGCYFGWLPVTWVEVSRVSQHRGPIGVLAIHVGQVTRVRVRACMRVCVCVPCGLDVKIRSFHAGHQGWYNAKCETMTSVPMWTPPSCQQSCL